MKSIARVLTGGWGVTVLFFLALLSAFFYGVFPPGHTLFSNDGPLSELVTRSHHLPARFTGCWQDLNVMGFNGGSASPDITLGMQWLLGPVLFSKFYAIISLLLLGMAAWMFFRQSRLAPLACSLGALAAMFNSTIFSVACWGVAAHVLTIGMFFLALAALADTTARWRWLRVVLAGFAVGMGVSEGADVGAFFSIYVAAFIAYQAWIAEGSRLKNLAVGAGRLAVVVIVALVLSAQALYSLVTTAEGVAVSSQQSASGDAAVKRWNWATQWSLPKTETLALVVPGLFGYRMDTHDGGAYWGMMGRDELWQEYIDGGSQGRPPKGFARYTGGGNYLGVLVALLAVWAAAQSLQRKNSIFEIGQRRWLWFWLATGVVSLMLAWGRYAPFYHYFYELPYFSTIRNPTKFIYTFGVAMVVLFAFGVDSLQRRYLEPPKKSPVTRWLGLGSWWKRASRFEKSWVYGCVLVWLAAVAGWVIYSQNQDALQQYLQNNHVPGDLSATASFSIHRVGWFVVTFFLASGLMVLILSGAFNGKQSAGILLALILVGDLGLANQPWIIFWNYQDKYTSNAVLDILKDQPYEHRVAIAPVNLTSQTALLGQLYRVEWMQQQFPYYNIESFDAVEMPRIPEDLLDFRRKFTPTNGIVEPFQPASRAWELCNTRYVIAPTDFGYYWNQQPYLSAKPLQTVMRFNIVAKPGVLTVTSPDQITVEPTDDGRYALFEYPSALPRASLYSRWQVNTNGPAVLDELADPSFDPHSTVIVDDGPVPVPPAGSATNASAGTVNIVHYAPKDCVYQAVATTPAVMLVNSRIDPAWKVWVDGRPAPLLRCNFMMRGVYLAPGPHQIEFKFLPPVNFLYVSAGAVAVGLLLLGVYIALLYKDRVPTPTPAPLPPAQIPVVRPEPKRQQPQRPKAVSGRNGKR